MDYQMNQDVSEQPYQAIAVHRKPSNSDSQIELQIVPESQADPLPFLQPKTPSSTLPNPLDIFKSRIKTQPSAKFNVAQPTLQCFYPPIASKAPEICLNTNNRIADYISRKQMGEPKMDKLQTVFNDKKAIDLTVGKQAPKEQLLKKYIEVPEPPPFRAERKAEKAKLKNLEKYRNIEIRETGQSYQERLERAVQEKLKREYGNILSLDRKKAEQKKLTDQQIKIWLKNDSQAPVKIDKKPIALSFINQHRNSYSPLLRIILSHPFSQSYVQPQQKKIPTIFPQKDTYEKTFQFLIFNQTIASLHNNYHQFKKSQNSRRPIRVMLKPGVVNQDGFFTFTMKENIRLKEKQEKEESVNVIRNLSLSKFNLVLISDSEVFDERKYSTTDFRQGFTFVACLMTPESKEQLAADIRLITMVNGNQYFKQRSDGWTMAYAFVFEKVSTFVKEFLAVRNVQFTDLAEFIYDPPLMSKSNPTYVSRPQYYDRFFQRLEGIYNPTQFGSIRQLSLRDKGIIMLQGPPGTGKTSTLLGVLSGQYHYLKSLGQLSQTKILVCTPSNTAIDHITRRLVLQGLYSTQDQNIHPKLLRMGIVDTNDQHVRSVYLDQMCEKQLIETNKEIAEEIKWTIPEIKDRITVKLKEIRRVEMAMKQDREDKELKGKLDRLIMRKNELEQMAYLLRRKRIDDKSTYNQIQRRLISQAEIILTTLSSSGSEKIQKLKGQFACLIVDQAGQCTEPNLLISLQLNINKILLIGDPCQLPATTFSPDSNVTLFNRSMFQRMIDAGLKPYFLDIQYRMTPQIRFFPSRAFYNGRLMDAQQVLLRPYPRQISSFKQSNVFFVDVKFGLQRQIDKSYQNQGQIQVTTALIQQLHCPKLSIGVITPYKQQLRRLQSTLRTHSHVFINTIDSFQGQQKDIIIISTVRASKKIYSRSLGFLIDERRINVALTRSKFLLIVIGNADTLGSNEIWNNYLNMMEKQGRYVRLRDRENYREGLRRLVRGQLEDTDKMCERERHVRFSKDSRKIFREEINLQDFIEPTLPKIGQQDQEDKEQGEIPKMNRTPPAQKTPPPPSQDDKWCVSAAQKNFDRILKKMYGQKSIFDILKDIKQ